MGHSRERPGAYRSARRLALRRRDDRGRCRCPHAGVGEHRRGELLRDEHHRPFGSRPVHRTGAGPPGAARRLGTPDAAPAAHGRRGHSPRLGDCGRRRARRRSRRPSRRHADPHRLCGGLGDRATADGRQACRHRAGEAARGRAAGQSSNRPCVRRAGGASESRRTWRDPGPPARPRSSRSLPR